MKTGMSIGSGATASADAQGPTPANGSGVRRRRHFTGVLLGVFVLPLLAAGCASGSSGPDHSLTPGSARVSGSPAPPPVSAFGPARLREALTRAGLRVTEEIAPTASAVTFFGPSPRALRLHADGALIQLFLFSTAPEALRAAATVSSDGTELGTGKGVASVDWVGPPHFFRSGRLIALFVESSGSESHLTDAQVLRGLSAAMGKQFAGQ